MPSEGYAYVQLAWQKICVIVSVDGQPSLTIAEHRVDEIRSAQ
jgi:hypothetical protein